MEQEVTEAQVVFCAFTPPEYSRLILRAKVAGLVHDEVEAHIPEWPESAGPGWHMAVDTMYSGVDLIIGNHRGDVTITKEQEHAVLNFVRKALDMPRLVFKREFSDYDGVFNWYCHIVHHFKYPACPVMGGEDDAFDFRIRISNKSHNCKIEKFTETFTKYRAVCKDEAGDESSPEDAPNGSEPESPQ